MPLRKKTISTVDYNLPSLVVSYRMNMNNSKNQATLIAIVKSQRVIIIFINPKNFEQQSKHGVLTEGDMT